MINKEKFERIYDAKINDDKTTCKLACKERNINKVYFYNIFDAKINDGNNKMKDFLELGED